MTDEVLDIFSEDPNDTPETEPQDAVTDEAQAEPEQAESVEEPGEQEADEAESAAPPAADPEKEPQHIPITALLDEREKRQEATRRAEEAERAMQQLQAQIRQAQQQRSQNQPDWLEDPEAASQHQMASIQQVMQEQVLNQSRFFAEREFGKETVQEAVAWFDQHPQLSHQFLREPSPFHAAVEFYKRQMALDEIGDDPTAYREKVKAELMEELKATARSPAPKTPPASLATAPSAGRHEPATVNAPPNLAGLFGS